MKFRHLFTMGLSILIIFLFALILKHIFKEFTLMFGRQIIRGWINN